MFRRDRPLNETTDPTTERSDVAVIGAGPVGLFSVFECGLLGMSCQVVDALDTVGGQCRALYPEKPIYDIPGFSVISGADLVERLAEQAEPFGPVYHLGAAAQGLTKTENGWRVTMGSGLAIEVKAVIIAGGAGAFGPNRPPLAGIEAYESLGPGRGVNYWVGKREDYRGKKVVIAGGGDSAVDWALSLSDVAERVSLVHRRPKFRAAPASVERLDERVAAGAVDLVVPYQLAALEGDDEGLKTVVVRDFDDQEKHLAADVLLPFFGLAQDMGPVAGWGLETDAHHILVDPTTAATNLPGVFAVGDIAYYPNKHKLILTGFSEAAFAAHAAYAYVFPDRELHFEHSTSKGLPTETVAPTKDG